MQSAGTSPTGERVQLVGRRHGLLSGRRAALTPILATIFPELAARNFAAMTIHE